MKPPQTELSSAIAQIPDGAHLALSKAPPMRAVIELARRQVRDLSILGFPVVTVAGDLLTAAGCVRRLEGGSIHLGEFGRARNVDRAWAAGRVEIVDTTCPIIELAVTAGAHGIPFIPVRGGLGSQVTTEHPDFKVMTDPFDGTERLLVPSITPDYLVISALRADAAGNIVVRRTIDEGPLVKASKTVIAVADELVPDARVGLSWTEELISAVWIDTLVPPATEVGPWEQQWDTALWQRYVDASASDDRMRELLAEMGVAPSLVAAP